MVCRVPCVSLLFNNVRLHVRWWVRNYARLRGRGGGKVSFSFACFHSMLTYQGGTIRFWCGKTPGGNNSAKTHHASPMTTCRHGYRLPHVCSERSQRVWNVSKTVYPCADSWRLLCSHIPFARSYCLDKFYSTAATGRDCYTTDGRTDGRPSCALLLLVHAAASKPPCNV